MSDARPSSLVIDDGHYAEQFPLAPIDDYMIHQTPDPVRIAWSSDPRVYERYWAICHDDVGEVLLVTGGSFYPNLDTAEAFAILNVKGQHASVRAFRRLGADRMDLRVGPLAPTIVRGLRHWHYHLGDNDYGLRFDLDWYDERRQIYHANQAPAGTPSPKGRQSDVTAGFEGFGTAEGWVELDGVRREFDRARFRGTRDRHWGVGRGVGGPAFHLGRRIRPGWIGGNWIAFRDFAIWGNTVLYHYGDPRPAMGRVVETQRRLRFEPETKIFVEGIVDYTLDDGTTKQVHFERLGQQTAYMRCGLYGGTPEGNVYQGQYVGDDVVEGDRYDLSDPAVRRTLSGLNEHHCVVSCEGETTTGILQPVEPDAYEVCAQGRPGWAFLE